MLARSVPTCWQTRSFPIGQACWNFHACTARRYRTQIGWVYFPVSSDLRCLMQVYGPATGPTTGPSTWPKKPALSNRASMLELPCWHRKTRFRRTKIARFTFLGQLLRKIQTIRVYGLAIGFFHQRIKDAGRLNDSALSRFWGFDVKTKPITSGTKRWLTTHPHHGMM